MTNSKCHNDEFWTHSENSSFWPSIWEFVVLAFWVWQSRTFEKNYSSLWQVTAVRWTNRYTPMLVSMKPMLFVFASYLLYLTVRFLSVTFFKSSQRKSSLTFGWNISFILVIAISIHKLTDVSQAWFHFDLYP